MKCKQTISFKTFHIRDLREVRLDQRLGDALADSKISPYDFLSRQDGRAVTMRVNGKVEAIGGIVSLPNDHVVWIYGSEDLLKKPVLLFKTAKVWLKHIESIRPVVTYVRQSDTAGLKFAKRLGFTEVEKKEDFFKLRY